MSPSRYQLPQVCSPDRSRARRLTLNAQRRLFDLKFEDDAGEATALAGHARSGHRLPPYLQGELPTQVDFGLSRKARRGSHRALATLNGWVQKATIVDRDCTRLETYAAIASLLGGPPKVTQATWESDASFARARLQGVNPMQLRQVSSLGDRLTKAAATSLREYGASPSSTLFMCDYSALAATEIQQQVKDGLSLAAPTAVFFVDSERRLQPLAIRLMPEDWEGDNPVFTPFDDRVAWLFARSHCQAADAHFHEGIWHLGETHLVSETIAICFYRNLHPDHPVSQLLAPHVEDILAIDSAVRRDLMTVGGPVDRFLASGIGGALDLTRGLYNGGWDYRQRCVPQDIAERGLSREDLPVYPYRDDALQLHEATDRYVRAMLDHIYPDDDAVRLDHEVQSWIEEISGRAAVPGFPSEVNTRGALAEVCREVIFRSSVQHAAVNNGRFHAYGWVPHSPGRMSALHLPEGAEMDQLLVMMPGLEASLAQLSMSWVLSEPTHHSLLGAGDSPAFSEEVACDAWGTVHRYRRDLRRIADDIVARNRGLDQPYTGLNPHNIARGTGT